MVGGPIYGVPNPECKSFAFSVGLYENAHTEFVGHRIGGEIGSWSPIPGSNAKVFPDYVPVAIRNDYAEACAIRSLSPKSSATLARRALQGMIRDFWNITKYNLKLGIEALKEKVDPLVWQAIDEVREVGNIGAHMEKNINHIVEVEPDEADKLIGLVEYLVDDWYVNRRNRQEQLEVVGGLAREKKGERQSCGCEGSRRLDSCMSRVPSYNFLPVPRAAESHMNPNRLVLILLAAAIVTTVEAQSPQVSPALTDKRHD